VGDDGVEAEERLLAVEDVELEERRRRLQANLDGAGLDEAEVGELVDGVGNRVGAALRDCG
jgi:hypothetical protein